jgi:hypothetical protein
MKISMIETASPYYCIMDHDGLLDIIDCARDVTQKNRFAFVREGLHFKHCRLTQEDCQQLLRQTPLTLLSNYCSHAYASLFITSPGYYYRAHKDGMDIRFALNYMLEVSDQDCVTSWYSDDVELDYTKDNLNGMSRELDNFTRSRHQPVCQTTFLQNQCVLFNTDVYHDFDNSTSNNTRIILTIRYSRPTEFHWTDAFHELCKYAN